MHKMSRCISALGAVAVAVASLTACGGGSEVVAQVGGNAITKATLDHWISIEAILLYEIVPRRAVPRGVVPDPPDYTACIAFLKSQPVALGRVGPKPTAAQLKSSCQQEREMLKEKELGFLIGDQWMFNEAAEWGLKVTDKEVRQRLEQIRQTLFPKKVVFQKYLANTEQTIPDWLFRAKVGLLELELRRKIFPPKGLTPQQQQALTRLASESTKKWLARTSCRAGYVVPRCKQYKGALPPGI